MNRLDAVAGVRASTLELRELVRLHASTINGCAYCVDMHSKDARAAGETEQRLYSLGAWREAPWFTPAERAALALTEAVTVLHEDHVPAAVMEEAARHFEPEALAQLVALLVTINAWNRIGVTTRCWEPGQLRQRGLIGSRPSARRARHAVRPEIVSQRGLVAAAASG